jgi:serine/threonine protein kinase
MPKRIGKYEITTEIGRGGFSRVYRGFDPNVNRPVAIKVSTRESDPEHLNRFRNEASAAGNLRHENIVTIHDYGDDDGVPYLVMELLDGRDLHHIMRDGPKLSLLEKMQIMSQVAEGLNCAHLNGVVHRDIKPANVMVLADGTVKILDFGIARMTGEVSRLTQSGYLVGTPLYMSPEQLSGGDADGLCDVWAYGVLYFELLTGQHPFLSQDNARLIRNITIVNPPSVHSITRGVPEGLAQVLRRALTKDRRRRYQSLEEVLVDTNPILGLLQREQTAGLVTEAQYYRSSGQLIAARQTSRRALEIDPSNHGAQQLLKSIQSEMQEESLATPYVAPAPPPVQKRPEPPAPKRMDPPAPPPQPVPVQVEPLLPYAFQDEPEMVLPEPELPLTAAAYRPDVKAPVIPPPVSVPVHSVAPLVSAAAAAAAPPVQAPPPPPAAAPVPVIETPGPSTTQRLRPAAASGAAAAIAAAVAAAKARQAEEERLEKEREEESAPPPPPIKATPLVVSALPTTRITPPAPPTNSYKRTDNGSGMFVTGDPLVVKRPAAAVMTQRMKTAEAAVATPVPAPPPPTRLPGTKAIPPSVSRATNGTTAKAPAAPDTSDAKPAVSENLPMRRPPSEVYAKNKRRRSSSAPAFAEKAKLENKPFPWAVVGFVLATAIAAAAVLLFSLSAPKYVNTPALLPDKMTFAWKPDGQMPPAQDLKLKGGAASSVYTASSDQDWLLVTPDSDEAANRSWQVRVEPDKLGTNVPNTYSAWIDVSSTEGFKTQAEVTLKIGAPEQAAPVVKSKRVTEKPAVEKAAGQADKKETPLATVTVTPAAKKPAASTAATSTDKTAAIKAALPVKKAAADGTDTN